MLAISQITLCLSYWAAFFNSGFWRNKLRARDFESLKLCSQQSKSNVNGQKQKQKLRNCTVAPKKPDSFIFSAPILIFWNNFKNLIFILDQKTWRKIRNVNNLSKRYKMQCGSGRAAPTERLQFKLYGKNLLTSYTLCGQQSGPFRS